MVHISTQRKLAKIVFKLVGIIGSIVAIMRVTQIIKIYGPQLTATKMLLKSQNQYYPV